jgi:hypothetical protein
MNEISNDPRTCQTLTVGQLKEYLAQFADDTPVITYVDIDDETLEANDYFNFGGATVQAEDTPNPIVVLEISGANDNRGW